MAFRGQPIAQADRAPLPFIGRQQIRAAEALHRRGELPAEIDRVADAGVHAVAAGRDVLMRGIACQEDTATLIALGQQQVREPRIGDQDVAGEAAPGPFVEQRTGINRRGIDSGRRPGLQGPGIRVVLRDQGAERGLIVPGDTEGLQQAARVGREVDHVAMCDLGFALEADAQPVADDAGAAVAAGEEIAAHFLRRAGLGHAQGTGDAGLVLHETLERRAPARLDQRMVDDGRLQHRLDHHLAHPHGGLAGLRAVILPQDLGTLFGDAGILEAMQFAASQRRDPRDVEIVLLRHGDGAQLVGDADTPEQLHRAAVGDVHLRVPRGRGIALDQQAAHAELR